MSHIVAYAVMDGGDVCMEDHHYLIFEDEVTAEKKCKDMAGNHNYVASVYVTEDP